MGVGDEEEERIRVEKVKRKKKRRGKHLLTHACEHVHITIN